MLQQLAVLATTVDAVQQYTDKIRTVSEAAYERQQEQTHAVHCML